MRTAAIYTLKPLSAEQLKKLSSAIQPTVPVTSVTTSNHNTPEFVIDGTKLVKYQGSSKKPFLPANITEIAPLAFEKNILVEELTIPPNVTSIGKWAFAFCKNLKKVTLPKNLRTLCNYTFAECSDLSEVILLDGLVTIEESAFYKCSSLKKIKLPKSVRVVHEKAFVGFDGRIMAPSHLRGHVSFKHNRVEFYDVAVSTQSAKPEAPKPTASKTTMPSNNATKFKTEAAEFKIEGSTLMKYCGKNKTKVTVPPHITTLSSYCFYDGVDHTLEEIIIPDTVNTIGKKAFLLCKKLQKITLPKNLKIIEQEIFGHCESLKNISLPANLTTINEQAFGFCDSLKEIKLPAAVKNLHENAFRYYYGTIIAPESLRGHKAFEGHTVRYYDIQKQVTPAAHNMTANPSIPEKKSIVVSSTSDFIIEGTKLKKYQGNSKSPLLPANITEIAPYAFSSSSKEGTVEELKIPGTVKTISYYAFSESSIKKIFLPKSIINIDESAFTFYYGIIFAPESLRRHKSLANRRNVYYYDNSLLAAYIDALVDQYDLKQSPGRAAGFSYYSSNSVQFEKKLARMKKAFAQYPKTETPLLLWDDTFFNTCKKGFLLTDKKLYIKDNTSARQCDIEHLKTVTSTKCDDTYVNIFLTDSIKKEYPVMAYIHVRIAGKFLAFWEELLLYVNGI